MPRKDSRDARCWCMRFPDMVCPVAHNKAGRNSIAPGERTDVTEPAPLPASLWAATAAPAPATPPLAGEKRADVAIIGGGYTGLSAALHLAEAGADVVVPGSGGTGLGRFGAQQRPDQPFPSSRSRRHRGPVWRRGRAACRRGLRRLGRSRLRARRAPRHRLRRRAHWLAAACPRRQKHEGKRRPCGAVAAAWRRGQGSRRRGDGPPRRLPGLRGGAARPALRGVAAPQLRPRPGARGAGRRRRRSWRLAGLVPETPRPGMARRDAGRRRRSPRR